MHTEREMINLLKSCRNMLDDLIDKKPGIEGIEFGSTTIGKLRAELYNFFLRAELYNYRDVDKDSN